MAIYYMDSSALIKHYLTEKGSNWINNLFDPMQGNLLYISRVTDAEFASSLSRRVREGAISQADHANSLNRYFYQQLVFLRIVEMDTALTAKAAQLTLTRALRSNDSIQLASAIKINALFVTYKASLIFLSADVRLLAAAQAEGLLVDNPENYP